MPRALSAVSQRTSISAPVLSRVFTLSGNFAICVIMPRNGLFDYSGSGLNLAAKTVRVSRVDPRCASMFEADCPNCDAVYQVMRAEAGPESIQRDIPCWRCGGPLPGRDGRFVLKYFLVERPWVQALGRRGG